MDTQPNKEVRRFDKLRSGKHVKRRLRKIESSSLKHAHTFVVKRWQNVREVRRHALGWLLLVGVLISVIVVQSVLVRQAYQTMAPAEEGTYTEGVLGQFDSLNPIYATTQPERSASRLLFSGLLTYDARGSLRNDLAQSWKVSEAGQRYTFTLKPNLQWDDGQPITAQDVAFTISSIKNADTRSPMYSSWRDIKLTVLNDREIQFDLPVAYAPFPHFLTLGILPAHKFAELSPAEFRNAPFNRQPVGSGPFSFRNMQIINAEQGRLVIHMIGNKNYHGGHAKLERFQLHIYNDRDQLKRAFGGGEISSVADFTSQDLNEIGNLNRYYIKDIPLNNVAMAIFKTDTGILQDVNVRKALRQGTDRQAIIKDVLMNRVTPLDTPIPKHMLSRTDFAQPAYDFAAADQALTQAGWVRDAQGKRVKDAEPLRLSIVTIKTGDYPKVLESLTQQWSKLGVTIDTMLVDPDNLQQTVLAPRAYDVLLYDLAVGGDPDVYAYWHSTQANARGLNLANYNSGKADDALSSARGRFEADLRNAKYNTFVEQWLSDTPAVVLYQPNLHYVSRTPISIDEDSSLVDMVDRYRRVNYWHVSEAAQNRTP